MLAAVILAAGESRRMGFPKALLPFRGQTFLDHLIEVTRHPRIGPLRVVLGAHQKQIGERVPLPPGDYVLNPEWQNGQLSSIRAAIRSLAVEEIEGMLLALVDHPFVTCELIDQIIACFDQKPGSIVIPTWQKRRGHPVVFPVRLFGELITASDETGARAVVWAHAADVVELPAREEGILLDIDDRDAYERLFPSASDSFPTS